MPFTFASFAGTCEEAALIPCPRLGPNGAGIEPTCYSRNVDFGSTIIFQPGLSFVHIVALIMVCIMVFHIRSKYTAVGRKEIVLFFYLYAAAELLALLLDSGIVPTSSKAYLYLAAGYCGLVVTTFWALLINGFVGFQWAEDGTPASLWTLRLTSLAAFGISFFVAFATFSTLGPFSPTTGAILWIFYFMIPLICAIVYTIAQVILVVRTLDDRWALGDIAFGVFFFAAGRLMVHAFSVTICDAVQHYIDGLFFGNLCTLLSVMMVYKYWDSITKEDLEFTVHGGVVWAVKGES